MLAGLVGTCEGQRHVGTTAQGRWGRLGSEHYAGEVCCALPQRIAWVEMEEAARGVWLGRNTADSSV